MANKKSKFLFYAGIVTLVFVVLAFGSLAIVQPFRVERFIKPVVTVHILLALGWLVLFVVQCWLVIVQRIERHRKNATLATILVLITTLIAIYITYQHKSSVRLIGESRDVVIFAALYFASIWAAKRGKIKLHKILMLVALLNFINPALHRFGLLIGIPVYGFAIISSLVWITVPIFYDVYTSKKIHKTTTFAITFTLVSYALMAAFVFSPFMESFDALIYPK